MNSLLLLLWFCGWLSPALAPVEPTPPPNPQAVVRAVLFYSPSCGHCEYVITQVLPPLFEQYGDQLQLLGIDVSQIGGQQLFMAALAYFGVESGGVPFLVVGDTYLVGSLDIPEQFPGMIERALAQGGLDWPALPGLAEALAASQAPGAAEAGAATPATPEATLPQADLTPAPGPTLASPTPAGTTTGGWRDLLASGLAGAVLAGMILSLAAVALFYRRIPAVPLTRPWSWAIPVLCLVGLVVAGYLAYVETAQIEAVCGPVGDCNAVQHSPYARLFGVLPVGLLGVAGYAAMLLAWAIGRYGRRRLAGRASAALLGMATFGVLFSIYLTFLELFVIEAACAWCLASAVLTTALFWLGLGPGKMAFAPSPRRRGRYSRT
jgi:uncharacterized membrane protein